jgi:MinD-like ATPase involved in chromosome partitioning or flagellar assembly
MQLCFNNHLWGPICRSLPNGFRNCPDPFRILFESLAIIFDAFRSAFVLRVFSSALLTSVQRCRNLIELAYSHQSKVMDMFRSVKESIDPLVVALFVEIFAKPDQRESFKFQLEQTLNTPLSQLSQACQKMNLKIAKQYMLATLEGKYQDIVKAFLSMSRDKLVPFLLIVCTDLLKSIAEVNFIH